MCQFYSCIVDRKLKVYDCVDICEDSHEVVIEKYKLNDKKLKNRDIVRLEVNPDYDKLTKRFSQKDWNYKVDEQGTLPAWYVKNEAEIKKLVWKRLRQIYKVYFLFGGEYDELPNDLIILTKDVKIKELKGNQKIGYMCGSSQVGKMCGSSQVGEMWGSSLVTKWNKKVKVKKREGGKTVVVDRSGDKVKVNVA